MAHKISYPDDSIDPISLIGSVIKIGGAFGGGAHFVVTGITERDAGNAVGKRLILMNPAGEQFEESWGFMLRCLSLGIMKVDQVQELV